MKGGGEAQTSPALQEALLLERPPALQVAGEAVPVFGKTVEEGWGREGPDHSHQSVNQSAMVCEVLNRTQRRLEALETQSKLSP